MKGLTLRVSPTGAKSWHFVYRLNGKPSQWLTLGTYPALTLVDARKQALDHRRAVTSRVATRVQAVISRMMTLALDRSLIDAHPPAASDTRDLAFYLTSV